MRVVPVTSRCEVLKELLKSNIRTDSKNIALLSIFSAMIIALEFLPLIGITDLKIPGTNFTFDPTGIPITLVFLFFGFVFSFISVCIMGIVVGYRNPIGSVFKFFAELFKIIGLALAWWILRNRQVSYKFRIIIYTLSATFFCALGMFIMNGAILLPLLYQMEPSAAWIFSATFVPLNIIQSVINVVVGGIIFGIIPENLKNQFIPTTNDTNALLELEDSDA